MSVEEKKKGQGLRQGIKTCPACRKSNGFYVYFFGRNGSPSARFQLRLVCPKCHRIFQVALIVSGKRKKVEKKR